MLLSVKENQTNVGTFLRQSNKQTEIYIYPAVKNISLVKQDKIYKKN